MADWKSWWLAQTPGWGAVKLRQLVECMGSESHILELLMACEDPETYLRWIRDAWLASEKGMTGECLKIRPQDVRRLWQHRQNLAQSQEDYYRWKEAGIFFVTISDPEYPWRLLQIYDPPLWIVCARESSARES